MKRMIHLAVAFSMAAVSLQIHAKDIEQVSHHGRDKGGCAPCTPEGCGEGCVAGCGEACVAVPSKKPAIPSRLVAGPALKTTPAPVQQAEGVYRLTSNTEVAACDAGHCDAGTCHTGTCNAHGSGACYHSGVCYGNGAPGPYHGFYVNPFREHAKHVLFEKAFPDAGWAPPAHTPINQVGGGFQAYWPNAWYGNPGGGYGPGAPMVYQPTDTTQLGYTYAHVPAWQPNPGLIPRVPNPEDFHARRCFRNCGSGLCPGSCDQCDSLGGACHGVPQYGGSCPGGQCYGAAVEQPAHHSQRTAGVSGPAVRTVSRQVATTQAAQRTVSPLATTVHGPAGQRHHAAAQQAQQRLQNQAQQKDGKMHLNPMFKIFAK